MEREKEIAKLVNVLRRTARMAMQSEWTGGGRDAAAFCAEQFNRVLARLKELDPDLTTLFEPLPEGASLTVVAMACRQLAAYYEDEVREGRAWSRAYSLSFNPEAFREFWCRAACEIEDLGEFIRESLQEWVRHKHGKDRETKGA
jgi:hypothetical protein